MQYIISQEEYNNLQFTIADLTKKYHEVQVRLDASRTRRSTLQAEVNRLNAIIKDIAGTVQSMSLKGSDFDIDEYGQIHR